MKTHPLALLAVAAAAPLHAQVARETDAHVHGVSAVELAVEGGIVEMTLLAPGMDIVGFEYAASTEADKDAVEAAIRTLQVPENVMVLPDAAGCRLIEAMAQLDHEDHDHDESDAHGDHHDDDHADSADHDAGDEHAHDDGHAHDDHGHADEAGAGAEHTEFKASYRFSCDHPEELATIGFPFFETFENAREIEAQYVTGTGAGAAEIDRDSADLTLD